MLCSDAFRLSWVAQYTDGSVVRECDGNSFQNVDRSRLTCVCLVRKDGTAHVMQRYEPGQRAIYRLRCEQKSTGEKVRVHLLGWQQTINGKNVQHISACFEDGTIQNAGKWLDGDQWLYEPAWIKQDAAIIGERCG